MLVKPADLDAAFTVHLAAQKRQCSGKELGEGRFSRAVDAKEPDAVIDIEPQIEIAQHYILIVTNGGAVELKQWWRERPLWRRQREWRHPFLDHLGDRLEFRQPLDTRLRLGRLAGLGAEPVDEFLQMSALGF